MSFIPVDISEDEILVKFLFDVDFKNKLHCATALVQKEIFLPHKGGSSIQRLLYSSENVCKSYGAKISKESKENPNARNRDFFGFAIFTKRIFDLAINEHRKQDFDARLRYSPLDENGQDIIDIHSVKIDDNGNVSHSDIVYINPEVSEVEVPSTAIRLFSRLLFTQGCKIVLDLCPPEDYNGASFQEIINTEES